MSIRRREDGVIVLEGRCPVEDAEPLLQMLQATPAGPCDWVGCSHLHTAVFQIVMAARPSMIGPCGDPWIERWVCPELEDLRR